MIAMRRELDLMKDHYLIQNLPSLSHDKAIQSALVGRPRPAVEAREARMETNSEDKTGSSAKRYYVEDLGEDMWLVDSKKKNLTKDNLHTISVLRRGMLYLL